MFRSALLEQMPLIEVNRTKSDLTNGDDEETGGLLLDTNTSTESKNNADNIRPLNTTQTEVRHLVSIPLKSSSIVKCILCTCSRCCR